MLRDDLEQKIAFTIFMVYMAVVTWLCMYMLADVVDFIVETRMESSSFPKFIIKLLGGVGI